jgi:serine/threonine protein kinase
MAEPPPLIALPAVPHPAPDIHNAAENRSIQVVEDGGNIVTEEAYLLEDSPNVEQAYQLWPRPGQPLEGRGRLVLANVLLRDQRNDGQIVFRRSEMSVAIKELRRWVIDPPLQRHLQGIGEPVNENPYNEVAVMQQQHHGDDQHILRCYEALWDTNYLYIVTELAQDGDLFAGITPNLGGGYNPPEQIPQVAKQLVRNLKYLEDRHLVHRDLKPENIVRTLMGFPFIDCAMTLQIPHLEGRLQLIESQGPAGSVSYISPEVFMDQAFNHKADVWAFGSIFFNLLTGLRLYNLPIQEDVLFDFFIIHGGLEDEGLCDRTLEELFRNGGESCPLSHRIQAVQVLNPVARNLLKQLLNPNPQDRPEVEEILNHPFFDGVP